MESILIMIICGLDESAMLQFTRCAQTLKCSHCSSRLVMSVYTQIMLCPFASSLHQLCSLCLVICCSVLVTCVFSFQFTLHVCFYGIRFSFVPIMFTLPVLHCVFIDFVSLHPLLSCPTSSAVPNFSPVLPRALWISCCLFLDYLYLFFSWNKH